MSSDLGALHPALVPLARWYVDTIRGYGAQIQITSTLRSSKRQQELYDEYLAGGRDLPVLPPGHSLHEKGLAWDMVVDGDYWGENQRIVGQFWKSLGGEWGPQDPVHFQPPAWWRQAL